MIGSFAASVLGIASHPAANDASAAGNLAAGIIRPERRFKLIVQPFSIAFNGLRQRVAVILRLIGKHLRVNICLLYTSFSASPILDQFIMSNAELRYEDIMKHSHFPSITMLTYQLVSNFL